MPFVPAFPADALAPGSARLFRDATHRVAVFRLADGTLAAVDDACPHEGYPLHQGEVSGCVLTCRWHTFRFRLPDGVCLSGDEAARAYPVRERDGVVEIDVADPDPAEAIARHRLGLADAIVRGKAGQAAREVARLLALGVPARDVLVDVVRVDARHGEYGVSHALALAADLAPHLHGTPERVVLVIQQAVDMAIDEVIRFPARPSVAATEGEGEALLAAIEAEDVDRAEGIARGLVRRGEDLFPWLVRACAAHFLGFGHGLIYAVKARELGVLDDEDVVAGIVVRMLAQNRDDLLPAWSGWRRWAATVDPGWWRRRGTRGGEALDLVGAEPPYEAVSAALAAGRLDDVLDALVVGASERMLRFELAHDDDPTVQEGWLDVTHTLTFTDAVREAVAAVDHPDVLRLVLQAVRFVHHARALDGARWEVEPLPDVVAAALERVLADRDPAPIVVAHLVKTPTAAARLARATGTDLPLRAATRLLASPVQQRFTRGRVHDAARFVFEGKVPRTLT